MLDGRLAFWRGHYFFILESSAAQPDLLSSFPPRLKKAIDERSLHPVGVFQLPADNLVRSSIRFYLGQKAMTTNAAVPRQLISRLGLEDQAEATIAHYGPDGFPLLLLAYPTPSLADEYAGRIQDALRSVFSEDGIYMRSDRDRPWACSWDPSYLLLPCWTASTTRRPSSGFRKRMPNFATWSAIERRSSLFSAS